MIKLLFLTSPLTALNMKYKIYTPNKTGQESDIPTKMMEENLHIFFL